MTTFLRLLSEPDKATALAETCAAARAGQPEPHMFEVAPGAFNAIPGQPFAYWVSESVRATFRRLPVFEEAGHTARRGPSTCDDFRYLRLWWESPPDYVHGRGEWRTFAKGGTETLNEAFANACEALDLCLESLDKLGQPAPPIRHRLLVQAA